MFDLDTFSNICVYLKNKDIYNLLSINKFFNNYNKDELYMNIIIIYFTDIKLKTFNLKINYKELYKQLIVIRKLPIINYFNLSISKLWELFIYSINNLMVDVLIFTISRNSIPISKFITSINLLINNLSRNNINKTLLCLDVLIQYYKGSINYSYIKLLIRLISLNIDINILNINEVIMDEKNKIIKKIISNEYSYELKYLINFNKIKYKFDLVIFNKIITQKKLLNHYINNLYDNFILDHDIMKLIKLYKVNYNIILSLNNLKIYNINKLLLHLLKNKDEESIKTLLTKGHIKSLSPVLIKKIKQHNFIKILKL